MESGNLHDSNFNDRNNDEYEYYDVNRNLCDVRPHFERKPSDDSAKCRKIEENPMYLVKFNNGGSYSRECRQENN